MCVPQMEPPSRSKAATATGQPTATARPRLLRTSSRQNKTNQLLVWRLVMYLARPGTIWFNAFLRFMVRSHRTQSEERHNRHLRMEWAISPRIRWECRASNGVTGVSCAVCTPRSRRRASFGSEKMSVPALGVAVLRICSMDCGIWGGTWGNVVWLLVSVEINREQTRQTRRDWSFNLCASTWPLS